MSQIFVNYRTGDDTFAAVLLDEKMAERFGQDNVFRDSRTVELGEEFRSKLWASLANSKVLLAVIGSRWLSLSTDDVRRLDMPHDYVRREIAFAFQQGIRVIPVLVGDTPLPREADLPDDIKELAFRQYLRIYPRNAHRDLRVLADELSRLLAADGAPVLDAARPAGAVPLPEVARPATPDAASHDNAGGDEIVHSEQRYSIVAVKVEGFASVPGATQVTLRAAMYDVLRRAADDARLPWSNLIVRDRVDGMLLLVPGPTTPVDLAGSLVPALSKCLRERADASLDPLRLRVALHHGPATRDIAAWVSKATSVADRLADAGILGEVLAAATRARLVLILSAACFAAVIAAGPRGIDPAKFLPVRVATGEHPDTGEQVDAWVCVPGYPAPPGLAARGPSQPAAPTQPSAGSRRDPKPAVTEGTRHRGNLFTGNVTIQGDAVGRDKHVHYTGEVHP